MQRVAIWRGVEEWRAEAATLAIEAGTLRARGTQIGAEPLPYRIDYELTAGASFITRELRIDAAGEGWRRSLALRRDDTGRWSGAGDGAAAELGDALDCDLGFSPLTNLMPVLRHDLHRRPGERDVTVAWVSVPELTVHAARQRYAHVDSGEHGARVRFHSLNGEFEGFTAELELDGDGLVRFYPGLARRV